MLLRVLSQTRSKGPLMVGAGLCAFICSVIAGPAHATAPVALTTTAGVLSDIEHSQRSHCSKAEILSGVSAESAPITQRRIAIFVNKNVRGKRSRKRSATLIIGKNTSVFTLRLGSVSLVGARIHAGDPFIATGRLCTRPAGTLVVFARSVSFAVE
jgi:hypothetical protein